MSNEEKVDPEKVAKLKERALKEASSSTIEDVLYGPLTDNTNASGNGEFDT